MRYAARTLGEVHDILASFNGPIAIADFFAGEIGTEVICYAQTLIYNFYHAHKDHVHVVALCWQGCSLLYSNVSDSQIELLDTEVSLLGNVGHSGEEKYRWLVENGHTERIAAMDHVVERFGPCYWKGHAMDHLQGLVPRHHEYVEALGGRVKTAPKAKFMADQLVETGAVFRSPLLPATGATHIAIFDRNEKLEPWRNTKLWQIKLFHKWAQELGIKLVVMAGLYPRSGLPDDIIHLTPVHRDMDLLCSVMQNALVYAAPESGAGNLAALFGCNYVSLMEWSRGRFWFEEELLRGLRERGFHCFGVLDKPDGPVARRVEVYLREMV